MNQGLISLFSGAGGLDLGFEKAGFITKVAYDIFPPAIETFNRNRKQKIARLADLHVLDVDEVISDIYSLKERIPLVGVIGGPPCQAFSHSNVYPREDDLRRTLPGRYAHLLKGLNAHFGIKFFVFENVRGLTFKRHQEEFARFGHLFQEAGFRLFEFFLNSQDFNIAQNRPRVFIVGLNQEICKGIEFAPPHPLSERSKTVREAFTEVFGQPPWPEPAFYNSKLSPEAIPYHPNHWTMVPKSDKFHNGSLKEGEVKGRSFRVLAWNKPSWTVAYGHREIHVHPSGKRRLSIFEALILQGFPSEYVLYGNLSNQVKLVSDAVPPPMAYQIAKSISNLPCIQIS